MTHSMTGFGKAMALLATGRLTVEIQSVNRRFLEISVSLPSGLSHYEMDIRKEVSARVARGFVSVRVHLFQATEENVFMPSLQRLEKLKESWELLASRLGYSKSNVDLPFLLSQMKEGDAEIDLPFDLLKKPLEEALNEFVKSRKKEGDAILKEIRKRMDGIERMVQQIKKRAPQALEVMRSKLKARFIELFPKQQELEDRVLREAAILAEKSDITEELDRLESHFIQFQKIPSSGDGKKMDFLVQEMGREVHTIGSKTNDLEITRAIVDLKGELEKVREQVQNIE